MLKGYKDIIINEHEWEKLLEGELLKGKHLQGIGNAVGTLELAPQSHDVGCHWPTICDITAT